MKNIPVGLKTQEIRPNMTLSHDSEDLFKYFLYCLIIIAVVSFLFASPSIYQDMKVSSDNFTNFNQVFESKDANNLDWINNGGEWMDNNHYVSWGKKEITYNVITCEVEYERNRIRKAFAIIQNNTNNTLTFIEVQRNADINTNCDSGYKTGDILGTFQSGEAEVEMQDYRIVKATLHFNNVREGYYPGGCIEYPATEIHEILHTLGFGHTTRTNSIMNPVGNGCRATIDKEIIDAIQIIYQ